ncbi:MAG: hypothetical protein PHF74_04915 [Dehalococcoidales bacterium]|nr:hypothetical protein [Dehalococcoidales bacterium]
MIIEKGLLKSFNSVDYIADVMINGSYKTPMERVSVARNIPSAAMIDERQVAVLFYDGYNSRNAVIIAVYD